MAEWARDDLYVGDSLASRVYLAAGGWWSVSAGSKVIGRTDDETSARRLAELLAGYDPGGIWRVAGEPVTVAAVKAVCPTVAVSWGPA